jgi:hypothetical protein
MKPTKGKSAMGTKRRKKLADRMKQALYKDAVVTRNLPEHRLKRGDIVKLVDHHVAPDSTEGYSIEVFNAVGDTIAVTAVPATALEPLREDEILCARSVSMLAAGEKPPT